MLIHTMKRSDFDYNLPKELIAQKPAEVRHDSHLMIVKKDGKGRNIIEHKHFYDIIDYLKEGDVLVVNNTKVLPFKFLGRKETGGKAEMILGNRIVDDEDYKGEINYKKDYKENYKKGKNRYECRIKTTKARIGTKLIFGDNTKKEDKKYQKEKLSHETCWSMSGDNKEKEIKSCFQSHIRIKATIVDKIEDKYIIEFDRDYSVEELSMIGEIPLPPYIKDYKGDVSKYQTVYSRYYERRNNENEDRKNNVEKTGSIAAPTAGLHFTDELLDKIRKKGVKIAEVCLHVSFGTFIPVRYDDIIKHKMEAEYYIVDEKSANIINSRKFTDKNGKFIDTNGIEKTGRLFVVGTTALKTLETAADDNGKSDGDRKICAKKGWSSLFIYPGYKFRCVDAMITNFHLPRSTLLLLVSAFAGRECILAAYETAKAEGYRFYSFGDAMLIV